MSARTGTINVVPVRKPLTFHTGETLSRATTFKYALDLNQAQEQDAFSFVGARRYTFNHHLGRVKANLSQREAERSYGITDDLLTPALSWSAISFINHMNQFKNGKHPHSPIITSGDKDIEPVNGLHWANDVSADVFETASVDAAEALKNFTESKSGDRKGKTVGFPHFKAKHKTTPAFRLRNRAKPGAAGAIRAHGNKGLVLPKLGTVRVHGCTRKMRRMLANGRFHIYSATVKYEKGRWWAAIQGMAAVFHHTRRTHAGRHTGPAGMDRGIKALAVTADPSGQVLHLQQGVKFLQHSEAKLKRANQALARTKPGSRGRTKAKNRLTRLHAQVAYRRTHIAHQLTSTLTAMLTVLVTENLNIAGMMTAPVPKPDPNRPGHYLPNGKAAKSGLVKAVADAAMGQVGRMLDYKAGWYNTGHVSADQWYASTKICSACKHERDTMALDERMFACEACRHTADRDVNAAANLADWIRYETQWRARQAEKRKQLTGAQAPPQAV